MVAPRVEWLEETGSTNADARERALAGERGPLWLAARRQTAGRGRRDRVWQGLPGNLFATGLYVLDCKPARAAEFSFMAALAVAQVCDVALGDPGRTRLKWPNDVLVDGRKVAGILLESGQAPEGGLWLAIGVGLNLAAAPAGLEQAVTSLAEAGGAIDRESALHHLVGAAERERARWTQYGFATIREGWLRRAHGLGEPCIVRLARETLYGRFADLAADGALRLELDNGQYRSISAGEVFFPDPAEER